MIVLKILLRNHFNLITISLEIRSFSINLSQKSDLSSLKSSMVDSTKILSTCLMTTSMVLTVVESSFVISYPICILAFTCLVMISSSMEMTSPSFTWSKRALLFSHLKASAQTMSSLSCRPTHTLEITKSYMIWNLRSFSNLVNLSISSQCAWRSPNWRRWWKTTLMPVSFICRGLGIDGLS